MPAVVERATEFGVQAKLVLEMDDLADRAFAAWDSHQHNCRLCKRGASCLEKQELWAGFLNAEFRYAAARRL